MARAKLQAFRQTQCITSVFCKALSHPARVMIFGLLRRNGRATFNDITANLPLSASTLCQHLEIMSRANLLEHTYVGETTGYKLRDTAVVEMQELLRELVWGEKF